MVKFHVYSTAYKEVKAASEKKFGYKINFDDFKAMIKNYYAAGGQLDDCGAPVKFELSRVLSEIAWIEENRPYYNFYPSVLEPANRLRLNNIPANTLCIPKGKGETAVILNFPEGHEIQNILVHKIIENRLFFVIRANIGVFQYGYFSFNTSLDMNIEDVIEHSIKNTDFNRYEDPDHAKYHPFIKSAVRYYAMAKFLTDCPNEDLISHDLPSRYVDEWTGAGKGRRKQILEKCKKMQHNGYNVALHSRIWENAGRLSKERQGDGSGEEQQYAHIRTGHLHAVRFGEQKKHVRLQWYMPIVVNKDKPFKCSEEES